MKYRSILNPCNPGYGASCALCCGSHNFIGKPEEMKKNFLARNKLLGIYSKEYIIKSMLKSRSSLTGSYYFPDQMISTVENIDARISENPQCPFIVCHEETGVVACLIYNSDTSAAFDCYRNYRSKNFSCEAKDVLASEEVRFAAELMGDWYYYSILIHHMDYLKSLVLEYNRPELVPSEDLEKIKMVLEKHADSEDFFKTVHSYFS